MRNRARPFLARGRARSRRRRRFGVQTVQRRVASFGRCHRPREEWGDIFDGGKRHRADAEESEGVQRKSGDVE